MSEPIESLNRLETTQDHFKENEWRETIFTATQCGIIVIDKKSHKIIDINHYALDIYGVSQREALNSPCAKFSCPSKNKDCMMEGNSQILRGEEREIEVKSKIKKTILVSVNEFSISGSDYFIENITDISARKKYEKELSDQKELLNNLLNSIATPIYYKDINGVYLGCNKAFEEFFSIESAQVIGKKKLGIFLDKLADSFRENDKRLIENGAESISLETRINVADNEMRDVIINKSIFAKLDGSIGGIIGSIFDITERKQLERSLKERSDFLRVMIDSLPNPILYSNIEGRYLGCNKAFEKFYGIDREKVIGKTLYEILPIELATIYDLEGQKILKGEHTLDIYEREEETSSGEKRLLMIYKVPYFDAKGSIAGLITSAVDISERKKIENELRDSEERYRLLADNSADVIWMLDKDMRLTYVSPSIKKLRGVSVEDAKKENIRDTMSPASYNIISDNIAKSQERIDKSEHVEATFEIEIYKIDGASVWVEISAQAVYGQNNEFIAFLGVSRDITQRKKNEDEINKLLTAIKQSPASVIITDIKGNIEYVNPKFTEVTGYTYEEALGNNPRILKSETVPSEEYKSMWQIISKGGEWRGEFLNRRKNGELYWENASISAVTNKEGIISHYIAVKEDITERKLKEEEIDSLLLQLMETNHIVESNLEKNTALIDNLNATKSKLEIAIGEKDKFISILSHDLKNPFVTLLNMSDLLLERFDTIGDEDKKSIIRNISKSSKTTYELLETLLEWSRAQMGGVKFDPINLDFSELCSSSIYVLKAQAVAKNINIENKIPDGSIVNCDKNMLLTIFRNLISNAIKFTNLNGNINISSSIAGENFIVKIEDNGIGIPKIILDNLFKTNEKISRKGTSGEASTGLGLLLCKEYIETHKGKIWATSDDGKGASFYFSLPLGER